MHILSLKYPNEIWKPALFIGLVFMLLSSCMNTSNTLSRRGIEKRRYTPGYHIDLLAKHTSREPVASLKSLIKNPTIYFSKNFRPVYSKNEKLETKATSADNPDNEGQGKWWRRKQQSDPTDSAKCGDEIIFRTGDKIIAKVLSVGINDISYKKCDNLTGPNYVVDKSEIFMIEYTNGDKDVFDVKANEEYYVQGADVEQEATSTEKYSIVSLVLGIVSILTIGMGGFLLGILGIIFGNKALSRIKNNEGRQKGSSMARTGIILGIVSIALTILIVVLALVFAFAVII